MLGPVGDHQAVTAAFYGAHNVVDYQQSTTVTYERQHHEPPGQRFRCQHRCHAIDFPNWCWLLRGDRVMQVPRYATWSGKARVTAAVRLETFSLP
jgi:hypothetical protein